eukprot:CAMPEP_0114289720 /NCGR_PEP_ID=MMETSP0059-20121206/7533_1 /TAXON_ID=36894 /ORGANISM="Pyramimonas parkeae, Strain CCMP726" /LENGTH=417 /DNA_ID=CAMNT_0001411029 /DNA_START=369 /DNA_END=1622 /DNA_ORIENTATION=+
MSKYGHRYGRSDLKFDDPSDRARYTNAWVTHYNSQYHTKNGPAPERCASPDKKRIPPTEMRIAGVGTSPFKSNFDLSSRIPARQHSRKEYYNTTLKMAHATPPDAVEEHKLRSSACVIGNHYAKQKQDELDRGQAASPGNLRRSHDSRTALLPKAHEFAGIDVERLYPGTRVSVNDRNSWNRNASNVGRVVFNEHGPASVPKGARHKVYRQARRPEHFLTYKQNDEARISKEVDRLQSYQADTVVNHMGYNVRKKLMDDTTISGETPAWMQLPGVNVKNLNSVQLATLMAWNSPVPPGAVDPDLVRIFQDEGEGLPEYHPELMHLPEHMRPRVPPRKGSDSNKQREQERLASAASARPRERTPAGGVVSSSYTRGSSAKVTGTQTRMTMADSMKEINSYQRRAPSPGGRNSVRRGWC